MFKSVFGKLIFAFAIIIFFSFVLLSVITGTMIGAYFTESKREDMSWMGEGVCQRLEEEYASSTPEEFIAGLREDSSYLHARLAAYPSDRGRLGFFLTGADGTVVCTGTDESALMQKKIQIDLFGKGLKEQGNATVLTDLRGLLGAKMFVYARSVSDAKGETLGFFFLTAEPQSQRAFVSDMMRAVIMSSLWVMLGALIAVFFISDRMVSPLKGMMAAARQFAKGKFDARVEITSNDEIGALAGAFNQMAESLGHLDAMRNNFLANVSHDLRTPMTAIAGFADGMRTGAIAPEEQGHYLDVISSETHRLSRLVEQLLSVARLESGERKFVFVNFDVCEMARLILISFEQKIEAKHLDVDFAIDEDNMTVYGDRDAIHQVLYNLCDNAVKFSREAGTLSISIRWEGQGAAVSIKNEGNGIPAEDLPMIFDRFYKTDKSRGLDKTGVGLGLYIAKTILDAHEQKITAESEEGAWCRFAFTLKKGVDELPARVVEI